MKILSMQALVAFAAFAVVGLLTLFVTNWGNEFNPILSLCVEYTKGFTGHTDVGGMGHGIAVAASMFGLARIAPKEEAPSEKGAEAPTANAPPIAMTDEQFRSFMANLTPKPEEIANAARAMANEPAPEAKPPVQFQAEDQRTNISVGEDRTPDHSRRAVTYLRGVRMLFNGETYRGQELIQAAEKASREMTDTQRKTELILARQIMIDAGIKSGRIDTYMRAMSTLTGAAGGYNMPLPVMAQIFTVLEANGFARQHANVFNWTGAGNTLDLNSVATHTTAGWVGQLELKPVTDVTLAQARMTVGKIAGVMSWSDELEEDQLVEMLPIYIADLGNSIAGIEDDAFFNGDGTGTYGGQNGLLGLIPSPNVVSNTLTTDNLKALRDTLSLARRMNAVYMMHPNVASQIETEQATYDAKNLQPVVYNPQTGDIIKIWGRPVLYSEKLPDGSSVGKTVIFGDPSKVLMGLKKPFEYVTSREGVLSNGGGQVVLNALQQNATILVGEERIGIGVPTAHRDCFSVLDTDV